MPVACDAGLAMLLARYDRDLARTLLEPAIEFLKLGSHYYSSQWASESLAAALAVTDPERALELSTTVLPERARNTIALVLARSGEERWRFVQEWYAHLWIVGKEDL